MTFVNSIKYRESSSSGWLVILSNGLYAPGISRMNHFTGEIVSLVCSGLVCSLIFIAVISIGDWRLSSRSRFSQSASL